MLQLRSWFRPLSKHSFEPIRCCLLNLGASMRRREFITLVGGAVTSLPWPLAARAQQPDNMRRIGVLTNRPQNDPDEQASNAAFLQRLRQLGWTEGSNVRIDYRWAAGDAE